MTPSHALRLQSMLRSVTEVIIPALDPAQQLAMDQAAILVGNLKLLQDQSDKTYQFLLVELREYRRLIADLLLEADGNPSLGPAREQASAAARIADPVLQLAIPAQAELADMVGAVKDGADRLLSAILDHGGSQASRNAAQLVMAQSETQLLRERSWLRATGFESNPEALPPIESLLDTGFAVKGQEQERQHE